MRYETIRLRTNSGPVSFDIARHEGRLALRRGDDEGTFEVRSLEGGRVVVWDQERITSLVAVRSGQTIWVVQEGVTWRFDREIAERVRLNSDHALDGDLPAPMTGRVIKVSSEVGAIVEDGAVLVVLEAMKMEYQIRAPFSGVVDRLDCALGAQVAHGDLLARIRKVETQGGPLNAP